MLLNNNKMTDAQKIVIPLIKHPKKAQDENNGGEPGAPQLTEEAQKREQELIALQKVAKELLFVNSNGGEINANNTMEKR